MGEKLSFIIFKELIPGGLTMHIWKAKLRNFMKQCRRISGWSQDWTTKGNLLGNHIFNTYNWWWSVYRPSKEYLWIKKEKDNAMEIRTKDGTNTS